MIVVGLVAVGLVLVGLERVDDLLEAVHGSIVLTGCRQDCLSADLVC